ncbi:MAG: hypothetical protein AAGC57_00970 [Pseudomonadota bacterium]
MPIILTDHRPARRQAASTLGAVSLLVAGMALLCLVLALAAGESRLGAAPDTPDTPDTADTAAMAPA